MVFEQEGDRVRRADVLDSTWRIFEQNQVNFAKKRWSIEFTSGERLQPGVDAGGPFGEWMGLVAEQLLDPGNGLFKTLDDGSYGIASEKGPLKPEVAEYLGRMYYFAGLVIGEALYSGLAVGAQLSLILCELLVSGDLDGFDYFEALKRIDHGRYVMLSGIKV